MLALFLAFLVFASAALGQTPISEPRFDVWLLEHADPKADLERNLARGDMRFLCVRLISELCPTGAGEWRIAKHGTRLIEDTTDPPRSKEHWRLIQKAKDYAATYNALLFEYLKAYDDI
jgi:hypothetical protein